MRYLLTHRAAFTVDRFCKKLFYLSRSFLNLKRRELLSFQVGQRVMETMETWKLLSPRTSFKLPFWKLDGNSTAKSIQISYILLRYLLSTCIENVYSIK